VTEVMNAQAEGDDIPEPVRVYLYGDGFASIDGALDERLWSGGAGTCQARELILRRSKTTNKLACRMPSPSGRMTARGRPASTVTGPLPY
jgi:hypothetical protein